MNPLVSVLIPSYNHSDYIVETLQSLCEQTYKNIEVIIIDDGSKDNSVEIIKNFMPKLAESIESVKFIQQSNVGICKTMNIGLQLSKGKYFCILPSDDLMYKNYLEKQVYFLEKNAYACSYTNGMHINTAFIDKKEYNKGLLFSEVIPFNQGNINSFLLYNVFDLPSPSFVYKTSVLRDIGGFDEDIKFEDVDLMLRISRTYEIGFIDEPLILHRIHSGNSGRNKDIIIGGIADLYKKFIVNNHLSLSEKELETLATYFEKKRLEQLNPKPKKYWFDIEIESLKVLAKNKKLVGWGTGDFAESFIFKYPDLTFDYFIDSNRVGQWNSFEVKSPGYLKEESNVFILILSSFNEEIGKELEALGFKKGLDFQ
ncbi:glycosyltransferase family 2 protein [Lysinibacillus cavernae]|uniref:glycosyltransferase family 2 protein n=1 Tax=Lysinibacillus cavernae TaxID=2666135 RepID=UPI0012D8AE0D|nr:glycosyltransferase [Lysinibacillus cavernae]